MGGFADPPTTFSPSACGDGHGEGTATARIKPLRGLEKTGHGSGAFGLGLTLWIAFPVVLLIGSVTHENVPWKLAAIHAGDWLAKLVILAIVVTVWR